MRRKVINPYHLIAFYDNDTEAARQGSFYSPTKSLPPMQFYLDSDVGIASWKLRRLTDGAEYNQDAGDWTASEQASPAIAFYTYAGTALTAAVPAGLYQAIVTLSNGGKLYSHLLCCTILFDGLDAVQGDLTLSVASCSQDFDYSFEMALDPATPYELYQGGNLIQAGTGPFTITGAPVATGNSRVHTIVIGGEGEDSNGGRIETGSKAYSLAVSDITNACANYTLTEVGMTLDGGIGEELAYIEWWEDNDDQALKVLYQEQAGGVLFRQRFYGKFWAAAPTPFSEEELLVSRAGIPRLRSLSVAQSMTLECWPVPDVALTPLVVAGRARNIRLMNIGGGETVIDYMDTTTAAIGEDDRLKIAFNMRYGSAVKTGCAEDYELA